MKINTIITCSIVLASHCYLPAIAGAEQHIAGSWQMTRLFHPTEAELQREAKGRVMIYDGLTDRVVERALDEQFERVETMMFTSVVITDNSGEPARDPASGEVLTEEDGCD